VNGNAGRATGRRAVPRSEDVSPIDFLRTRAGPSRFFFSVLPAWDADKHDGLLKTLNRYYVPTVTFDVDRADDSPDATLERRVNAVHEETRLQRDGNASRGNRRGQPPGGFHSHAYCLTLNALFACRCSGVAVGRSDRRRFGRGECDGQGAERGTGAGKRTATAVRESN